MKQIEFDIAIERVLSHEGGYVNLPEDPGGETQWGISKRQYPNVDIKALTRDQAKELYRRDFWLPFAARFADGALQFQLLDAVVNHGAANVVRMLQRAVGVADDGTWGPISAASLGRMDPNDVHLLFMAERQEFMAKLKAFDYFGRGWTRRLAQNLRYIAQDN